MYPSSVTARVSSVGRSRVTMTTVVGRLVAANGGKFADKATSDALGGVP